MKPEYKQTEVGVIPEEWAVKPLGEIGEALIGLTYKPTDVRQHGTLVLRSSNIQNDALAFDDNVFVDAAIPERIRVLNDDVLICVRNGSRDLIGKSALLDDRTKGMTFGAFMAVYRSQIGRLASYLFQSAILKRQINEHLGATINQITNKSINSFRIPVPTLPEQRAIATALSDVDGLLGGLDRLIAKKRDLKQAAMQQLLTGQTRLPGFSGEWEVKILKEVCWFQEGPGVRNTQFTSSGIKLLNGTNIFRGVLNLETTTRFISESEGRGAYAHFLADDGDIVLASSGITIERLHEKVAFVRPQDLPFCMNTSTIRFKPFAGILAPAFLFQFLTGDHFKRLIGGTATGSAQLNFGPSHVEKVELSVPPLPEQTAIASVLTDMDAELATLTQRRDKTRALKQAMMQELLTGRTRLV